MAQVVVELSADEQKLLQSYRKIQTQQNKVDTGNKNIKRSHESAFGRGAMADIRSYVVGMIGITSAIATVTKGLSDVQAQGEKIAEKQRKAKIGLGSLAQLAKSPADMQRMVAQARMTLDEGGTADLDEAGALQFALESAGVPQYRADISKLKSSGLLTDAKAIVDAAQSLASAYGEASKEFRDVVNIGFGASVGAPAQIDQLLTAAGKAGKFADMLGIPQSDLMAATATISKTAGYEEGGTYTRAFFSALLQQAIPEGKVKPGTLEDMVQQIRKQEEAGASTFDILGGNIRAVAGYGNLQSRFDVYKMLQGEIDYALTPNEYGKDAFARKIQFGKTVPEIAGANALQLAEGNEELAFTVEGVYSNIRQAIQKDLEIAAAKNFGNAGWLMSRSETSLSAWLRGDEAFIRSATQPRSLGGSREALSQDTLEAMRDAANALRSAAEAMEDGAEKRRYEKAANALAE